MMDFIGKLSGFVGKNLTYIVFLVVIWAYFMPNAFLWAVPHTGFVGTYAPRAVGAVLPTINSTTVYLVIFGINLVFLACFYQCLREVVKDEELLDDLVYAFFAHRFVAGVSFLFYDPEREQFLL